MMNISEQFYNLQNQWSGIYTRPVLNEDQEKASWISALWGEGNKTILEIGCGGGQFAAACAKSGHSVTAIDLEEKFIEYARSKITPDLKNHLTFQQANFYTYQPQTPFKIVCYLDGFGIGEDSEQIHLLNKIDNWLTPDGILFLEIYTPWYWCKQYNHTPQKFGPALRQYGYDPDQNRMMDSWWLETEPEQKVTQSLRCYTPADLSLLLTSTGLQLKEIFPGGGFDPESGQYRSHVPLIHAMSYLAKIVKKDLH